MLAKLSTIEAKKETGTVLSHSHRQVVTAYLKAAVPLGGRVRVKEG